MAEHSTRINRDKTGNFTRLYLGENITIWFSYQTPIAFAINGEGRFKSESRWSATTKRHLSEIAATELPTAEFEKRLAKLMGKINTATNRITPNTK